MLKTGVRLIIALLVTGSVFAQDWVNKMNNPQVPFEDVKASFETYALTHEYERGNGMKQFWRYEENRKNRLFNDVTVPGLLWKEYSKFYGSNAKNSSKQAGNWSPVGPIDIEVSANGYSPGHGRICAIAFKETDHNQIFVGTAEGGLWRTLDGGENWLNVTDNYPISGVGAVLLDANTPSNIIIGTGDKIARSSFGSGMYQSTDNGDTWAPLEMQWNTTSFVSVRDLIRSKQNPNIIYCVTNNGIYRSTNNGVTFDFSYPGIFWDAEIAGGNDEVIVASSETTTYYSTDFGDTWEESVGLPLNSNRIEIAVTPANENLVVAITSNNSTGASNGVYKSEDKGLTWNLLYNDLNIIGIGADGNSTTGQGSYDLAIMIDPENEEEIVVGGINLWKSENGGDSFERITWWTYPNDIGYVHPDCHALLAINEDSYFIGTDGGFYKRVESMDTFIELNAGIQNSQFYKFDVANYDDQKFIGGTQDNGSIYMNHGLDLHVLGGDGMGGNFHSTDTNIMFVSFQNGGIRRSTNAGQSFGSANLPNETSAWVTPLESDPNNPNHWYMGRTTLWKSTNNADSWQQISNLSQTGGSTIDELEINPVTPQRLMISKDNVLFFTENGGQTWANDGAVSTTNRITGLAYAPQNPSYMYYTLGGYDNGEKVFVSKDGGENWENITYNLPNVPVECIEFDSETNGGVYVGTDLGVYYTNDDMINWIPFNKDLPVVSVREIEFHENGNVYAATYGRGIYKSPKFDNATNLPVSDFYTETPRACVGKTVKFLNNSLYAKEAYWKIEGPDTFESHEDNFDVVFTQSGWYTVSLQVTNENGEDTKIKQSYIEIYEDWYPETGLVEGFENTTELYYTSFYQNDVNDNVRFEITDLAAANGVHSVKLNAKDALYGETYELIGEGINLENAQNGTKIEFSYAFRSKNQYSTSLLRLLGSTDCGETWTTLKIVSPTHLNTGESTYEDFVPEQNEWKMIDRTLSPSYRVKDFQFKIVYESRGGNNLFIDDINLTYVASVNENFLAEFNLYPNPTNNILNIESSFKESFKVSVLDVNGRVVVKELKDQSKFDVSHLKAGIYFVQLTLENGQKGSLKFVKQ